MFPNLQSRDKMNFYAKAIIYLFLGLTTFLLTTAKLTKAGIDEFTLLDNVEDWIIERKIDSLNQQVECRASIPGIYSWFGGRIRLNKQDKLVMPESLRNIQRPRKLTLKKVTKSLHVCRSSLLYLQSDI